MTFETKADRVSQRGKGGGRGGKRKRRKLTGDTTDRTVGRKKVEQPKISNVNVADKRAPLNCRQHGWLKRFPDSRSNCGRCRAI